VRYTLKSICSSPYTANKIFPDLEYYSSYVCAGCAKIVRAKTQARRGGTKRRWIGERTPKRLKMVSPFKGMGILENTPLAKGLTRIDNVSQTTSFDKGLMDVNELDHPYDVRPITPFLLMTPPPQSHQSCIEVTISSPLASCIPGEGMRIDTSVAPSISWPIAQSTPVPHDVTNPDPADHSWIFDPEDFIPEQVQQAILVSPAPPLIPHVEHDTFDYSFKTPALNYFRSGHYKKGFLSLINNSDAAKTAFIEIASNLVRQEITEVAKKKSKGDERFKSLEGDVTVPGMEYFSWPTVLDEAKEKCPTLLKYLHAMMPSVSRIRPGVSKGNKSNKR
jgi:hypothetical protein